MPSVLFQLCRISSASCFWRSPMAISSGQYGLSVRVGDVRFAVEQDVFVGRQALHHDAGLGQGGGVDLRLSRDQLLDLTADQVFLVRPELHLPRTVAFGQRADQQRLQFGPGFLRVRKSARAVSRVPCLRSRPGR
jgi:hypothetical protein